MQPVRNVKELMDDGRGQEQAGRWEAAADVYERIVEKDPGNRDAVKRLLMVYRRLKDFPKELTTIEAALGAVAQRDQSAQDKWLAANPQAAKLGKAMLRSLGGINVTAYGTDAFVQQLLKRKDLVERKMSGAHPARSKTKGKPAAKGGKVKGKAPATVRGQTERAAAKEKQREEAAAKKAEAREIREAAARAKREAADRAKKEMAERAKKETAERKKAEKAAAMEAKRRAAEAKAAEPPSFFVINLRYLVPLTKIDAAMPKHVSFLDKHFASGMFVMAGRQVPRTGGIIIAYGRDRETVDRIMRQDPFVKGKMASFDIVEFRPSKTTKGLSALLQSLKQ